VADKSWKAFERTVAEKMGGRRIGPSGVNTNDVEHAVWAIECKYKSKIPDWILDALIQANKGDGRTPIVFVRPKALKEKDVVMMWAKDFYEWFGVKHENQTIERPTRL